MNADTKIYVSDSDEGTDAVASYLSQLLSPATGYALEVSSSEGVNELSGILLEVSDDATLGKEGYELTITEGMVKIAGGSAAGIFYGAQTLRQLLPDAIEASVTQEGQTWSIPTGTIRDMPVYGYRGAMLDVARHFFDVNEVKRFIDFLAAYKMNVLHLHLSDDQGWRIEIKSWPLLTEHGGQTEVGGGKGGFYTQEQYKELVAYAAERQILVIPEIDVPGHTNAALASYPALNCDGRAPELYTGTEVGFSTLCTDKKVTYEFLNDVVRELAEITPGPYLHIGGDESHATKSEDYLPFVNQVQGIVKAHGKTMIGWDETAQADLSEGSVVQLWHNADFAKMAVQKGAKLIMSPANKAYLDMQYDSTSRIGLHWAAYIEVPDGYNWDPATIVPGIGREDIIGMECALWSETVTDMADIEYLTFPRLPGYAEIAWSASSLRNWESYEKRLSAHASRMESMGIGFYRSPKVAWAASGKE